MMRDFALGRQKAEVSLLMQFDCGTRILRVIQGRDAGATGSYRSEIKTRVVALRLLIQRWARRLQLARARRR